MYCETLESLGLQDETEMNRCLFWSHLAHKTKGIAISILNKKCKTTCRNLYWANDIFSHAEAGH